MKKTDKQILLRKLQLIEKNILDVFVSICEKENLKYYLYGGTVLGAVRHKGFIPWDDDIDVCMPRKDYDIFISVAPKYLKDNIMLQHYSINNNYHNYFSELIDDNVIINAMTKSGIKKYYAWIDIFPLDGVPKNKVKRLFHYAILNIYRWELALCQIENFDVNKKRSFIKNVVIGFAHQIPIGKIFNSGKICKKIDKQLKKQNYDDSELLGSFLGPLHEKEMTSSNFYGKGKELIFENDNYVVPEKAEMYLNCTYGEYMKLPPKEERIPHHKIISIEIKNKTKRE